MAILTLTKTVWEKDNPAYRQLFTSMFVPGGTAEQANWFNELQRKSTSPETAVRFLMEFAQVDVLDQLAKVLTPTLVIHTRGDLVNRFEDGRDLATLIPRAHLIPLESGNPATGGRACVEGLSG